MATRSPRRPPDDWMVDATDIEAEIARDQSRERSDRRAQWRAVRWGRLLWGLVVLYACWAWFWLLPQWYAPPPSTAWLLDLVRHVPRPPFL